MACSYAILTLNYYINHLFFFICATWHACELSVKLILISFWNFDIIFFINDKKHVLGLHFITKSRIDKVFYH
jgi:hypothetical protein